VSQPQRIPTDRLVAALAVRRDVLNILARARRARTPLAAAAVRPAIALIARQLQIGADPERALPPADRRDRRPSSTSPSDPRSPTQT
jgi:hypothetical protein